MKVSLPLIFALFLAQVASHGSVIYQNNFSGSSPPGWYRFTSGDTNFHNEWSITSSLESSAGNQYARFDINIPTEPTNSNVSWSGGFFTFAGTNTTLPAQWRLSFDVSLPGVEPIEISLKLQTSSFPSGYPPAMNFWVQPAGLGWQSIVIDQNTPYSFGPGLLGGSQTGTYLTIGMASQDSSGNPLTISQVGTYDFLLDNVLFQTVPEPSALSFCAVAAILFVKSRRRFAAPQSLKSPLSTGCPYAVIGFPRIL
jgi:hypothetical protein